VPRSAPVAAPHGTLAAGRGRQSSHHTLQQGKVSFVELGR